MLNLRFSTTLMTFISCGLAAANCIYADTMDSTTEAPSHSQETTNFPKNEPPAHAAPSMKAAPEEEKGKPLVSEEGHFSVTIPGGFSEVDMESQAVDTEVGQIRTVNYSASSDHSTYIVGSSDYPKDIIAAIKGKEQEIFEGAQEGLLMHMKGSVVSKKDLMIDGHKARTVEFTAHVENESLYGKLQLILAEPRLYHMLYITNQKDELNADKVKEFFTSLKIIPGERSNQVPKQYQGQNPGQNKSE